MSDNIVYKDNNLSVQCQKKNQGALKLLYEARFNCFGRSSEFVTTPSCNEQQSHTICTLCAKYELS